MKRVSLLVLLMLGLPLWGCQQQDQQQEISSNSSAEQPAAPPVEKQKAETTADQADEPTMPVAIDPKDLPQPVTLTAEDWPQYRGQQRDGISTEQGLLRIWPDEGPKVLWQTTVGEGYSAPSVVADRLYLNDYDTDSNTWMVRCLDLQSGDEHWRYEVKKRIRPNHAITRSAPATDGGFVFAIDPKCELHCLDARDGKLLWKKFLPEAYDSQIPAWYNGQCPLIDDDKLILATGGRVLMTALEKGTGQPVWETDNTEGFLLSHSSIMPTVIDGVKQYTYTTLKGLVGVDAATGELLWHFPWKFNTAVSSTPLPLGEGRFFLTAGYHAETVICQVNHDAGQWVAETVLSLPPPTRGWNSEVHTPILYRDRLFGVGKKQRGLWTCLSLEGEELWTSRKLASFGLGGYMLADGMFFVLEGDTGVLRLLDAEADEYRELASCKLLEGPDVWAPPVVSHGKLLIRDLKTLLCLDIKGEAVRVAESSTP